MSDMELFCLIFFGVWDGVGAVFLLVALILWRVRMGRQEKCTESIEGVVTALERHRGRNGSVYCPVVQFWADGRPVRAVSAFGSRPSRYVVGQQVQVRYDPIKPERFVIGEDSVLRLLEKIFLLVGLGCIFIGSGVSLIASRAA